MEGRGARRRVKRMPIQSALSGLIEAYEAARVPGPQPACDLAALDAISDAVAPLGIPSDLRVLWTSVDSASIRLQPNPRWAAPRSALELWIAHLEADFPYPRILFPLCHEGWTFLLVELETSDTAGGRVYAWEYAGGAFALQYAGIEDWVVAQRDAIRAGRFDAQRGRLGLATPGAEHAPLELIDEAPDNWPAHWASAEQEPEIAQTLPPTTIADAQARLSQEPMLIRATATDVVLMDGGARALLSDDSGELDVWFPSHVSKRGPTQGAVYEVTITAAPASTDRWRDDPVVAAALQDPFIARWGRPAEAHAKSVRAIDGE